MSPFCRGGWWDMAQVPPGQHEARRPGGARKELPDTKALAGRVLLVRAEAEASGRLLLLRPGGGAWAFAFPACGSQTPSPRPTPSPSLGPAPFLLLSAQSAPTAFAALRGAELLSGRNAADPGVVVAAALAAALGHIVHRRGVPGGGGRGGVVR